MRIPRVISNGKRLFSDNTAIGVIKREASSIGRFAANHKATTAIAGLTLVAVGYAAGNKLNRNA